MKSLREIIIAILVFHLATITSLLGQTINPNLVTVENGASFEASSVYRNIGKASNIGRDILNVRWETDKELEGAWIKISWDKPHKIKELWLVNKATPYDIVFDEFMRTGNYYIPRKVRIEFSDGTKMDAELKLCEYYQILSLPTEIETSSVKITVEKIWEEPGKLNTGLCKLKAFSKTHEAGFKINVFEMYDVQNDKPVQSAKVEIVNPGETVENSTLQILNKGKEIQTIGLDNIPSNSVSTHQIWIPVVFEESKLTFRISYPEKLFSKDETLVVKPYAKNYFDSGILDIVNMNHNDLGFQNNQFITADYRSRELILPALDLMKSDPDFKYTMKSVEYLKEFLIRHPERREEMATRMREKRFFIGAGYIQNLQVHVGQEKLVRQFYYGRRWLKENFPGCDTRVYMNADVPGFTFQLAQVLKKSGVNYIVQGRLPWGFYYWEGLDGTSIPVFALRYGWPYGLLNPLNNTGYLKFLNEREYYYKPRKIPKTVLYDFNADYLPPSPSIIPFAKNQNLAMEKFAIKWNANFKSEPEKQIDPPKIRFAEPESALDSIFGKGELNIETIKGDWPMSWAYYDEPGHREGLLMGRSGHNDLLKAEGLYTWINTLDKQASYPKNKLDDGWLANCWPDHGWGGRNALSTDSINVASYEKSSKTGKALVDSAGSRLLSFLPHGDRKNVPILVYNSVGWERTDITICKIHYPKNWKGLEVKDVKGNLILVEVINHSPEKQLIEIAILAKEVPSFGFINYYASAAKSFPKGYVDIKGDSIGNDFINVRFGAGGITSLYDKISKKEVLKTDKFSGGEVLQMTAPGLAWESEAKVTMDDFDKTSLHEFKTIRAVESPLRYIIEKEATFKYFTLHERFILPKHSRELIIEADILNWTGEKEKELRIVFPVNQDKSFRASYEVPFGTVEMGRDEIDYSYLPDNYESQFSPENYARKDLPFREALNWVDISSGNYKGNGCLFASDMTVHLFRDETTNPVDYPVVQHVMLSTRKSLGWEPAYWFTQPGNHSYRMALYPHDGNWRFAYKDGFSFNKPLTTFSGNINPEGRKAVLPLTKSFISVAPANIIISALKQAEDGKGYIVRFYEAEGRFTKVRIAGYKPFSKVYLTDMIEYDIKELHVEENGSFQISVKPWEIVTIRVL
jgi:alpha-mannosidase